MIPKTVMSQNHNADFCVKDKKLFTTECLGPLTILATYNKKYSLPNNTGNNGLGCGD